MAGLRFIDPDLGIFTGSSRIYVLNGGCFEMLKDWYNSGQRIRYK
jgi:hypothetical protein